MKIGRRSSRLPAVYGVECKMSLSAKTRIFKNGSVKSHQTRQGNIALYQAKLGAKQFITTDCTQYLFGPEQDIFFI